MQASANKHLAVSTEDAASSPTGSEDLGKRGSAYVRSQEDQAAIDQTRIKVRDSQFQFHSLSRNTLAKYGEIITETIQFHPNIFLLPHFHVELGDNGPVRLYPASIRTSHLLCGH